MFQDLSLFLSKLVKFENSPGGRGWTNQRAGNSATQWTTAAVPLGSVLAVMTVLTPSQETGAAQTASAALSQVECR
jgi:hypothetical protein